MQKERRVAVIVTVMKSSTQPSSSSTSTKYFQKLLLLFFFAQWHSRGTLRSGAKILLHSTKKKLFNFVFYEKKIV